MSVASDASLYWTNERTGVVKRASALDVSRFAPSTRMQRKVRYEDLETKDLLTTEVTDVIKRQERLYHIENDCGYILECTPDTEIYDGSKWIKVSDIKVGDDFMVNGQPSEKYKEKEWLEEWYVNRHKTQKEIAEMLSTEEYPISPRTIRAWVKRYGLGRGDGGQCFGEDNPQYKGMDVSKKTLYTRSRYGLVKKGICDMCGAKGETDIHHLNKDLLDDSDENLIELCEKCHQALHKGAIIQHIRPSKITDIHIAGVDTSFDIVTKAGNYVAEGFIIKSPPAVEKPSIIPPTNALFSGLFAKKV